MRKGKTDIVFNLNSDLIEEGRWKSHNGFTGILEVRYNPRSGIIWYGDVILADRIIHNEDGEEWTEGGNLYLFETDEVKKAIGE